MSRQGSRTGNIHNIIHNITVKKLPNIKAIFKFGRTSLIESVPFLLACAVFLSVISLKSPFLLFCLVFGSFIAVTIQQIGQQINIPPRWRIALKVLAPIIILSVFWLDYLATPAHAQFFGKAEKFFKDNLAQGANNNSVGTETAVSLIFNVLRGIFLLYIAVSLIGVINAVRKDEDWQSIARTPLLVVLAVTIADVMTGFVIGN